MGKRNQYSFSKRQRELKKKKKKEEKRLKKLEKKEGADEDIETSDFERRAGSPDSESE